MQASVNRKYLVIIMKWLDIEDIAITLDETHGNVNPEKVRFTELRSMVLSLNEFEDDEKYCNERILEAIQAAWINERG